VLTIDDADRHHRRKEKRRALAWKPFGLMHMLQLWRSAANCGGGHIRILACCKCTFQTFQMFQRNVVSVSYGCCKSRSRCCTCCK
jgi:hypothetical protein